MSLYGRHKYTFAIGFFMLRCLLLFAGSIRSIVLGDSRFGRAMFLHQVDYKITYQRVMPGGRVISYLPPTSQLRGKAKQKLSPDARHTSRYGDGAVKSRVDSYVEYIATTQGHPQGAVMIQGSLNYRINDTQEKFYLAQQIIDE